MATIIRKSIRQRVHRRIRKRVNGTGRTGDVFNPATGEVAAKVPLASTAEVRSTIAAAEAAHAGWSAMPPLQRATVWSLAHRLHPKAVC